MLNESHSQLCQYHLSSSTSGRLPASCQKGEVDRAQHQLHGHEHDQRVAPEHHTRHTDEEENGRQDQIVGQTYLQSGGLKHRPHLPPPRDDASVPRGCRVRRAPHAAPAARRRSEAPASRCHSLAAPSKQALRPEQKHQEEDEIGRHKGQARIDQRGDRGLDETEEERRRTFRKSRHARTPFWSSREEAIFVSETARERCRLAATPRLRREPLALHYRVDCPLEVTLVVRHHYSGLERVWVKHADGWRRSRAHRTPDDPRLRMILTDPGDAIETIRKCQYLVKDRPQE